MFNYYEDLATAFAVEGIATIAPGNFKFDSGFPADEEITIEQTLRGKLNIGINGSAEFTPDNRCNNQPPIINKVAEGDGYSVRRTSRNYIIQVKLPILKSRADSEAKLDYIRREIMPAITLDRKELLEGVA